MNIRQCRGNSRLETRASPTSCPLRKRFFLPWGCSCPRPTGAALAQPRNAPFMPTFDPVPSAKRLRKLLRKALITPHQFAVADALLWSCRAPGRDEAQISYDRLAKLAGVGRSCAVAAIRRLRDLGVLSWRKTRLRVAWSLGIASRQWRNVYRLLSGPCTEFAEQPTDSVQGSKKDCIEVGRVAPEVRHATIEALSAIALRRARTLGLA
jgi:hypothetical protein